MQQCFHPRVKHLLYRYITPSFVLLDIVFVLKVKLGTFLPIHHCAFWFNLKYIFVSLCKSRTLRMKLLTWCRVISLARLFGFGRLSLSEYFGPVLHTKLFYNIKDNDFFLLWRRLVVLTTVTSVSEVVVILIQMILLANTAAFFYSLLGLVPHCFWEGDSSEEISVHWKDQSLTQFLACLSLQAGFSYL